MARSSKEVAVTIKPMEHLRWSHVRAFQQMSFVEEATLYAEPPHQGESSGTATTSGAPHRQVEMMRRNSVASNSARTNVAEYDLNGRRTNSNQHSRVVEWNHSGNLSPGGLADTAVMTSGFGKKRAGGYMGGRTPNRLDPPLGTSSPGPIYNAKVV